MRGTRILAGSGIGTILVWWIAAVDPYVAWGVGAFVAGASVGVHGARGERAGLDGPAAAVGTLLVVLAGSLLSVSVPGLTTAAVFETPLVVDVFGYFLFGLLVPGVALAGLSGATLSRHLARRVAG